MYPLNILCVLHLTMPTVHIISLHIITLGGLRLKRDVTFTGTSPYWKIKTSPFRCTLLSSEHEEAAFNFVSPYSSRKNTKPNTLKPFRNVIFFLSFCFLNQGTSTSFTPLYFISHFNYLVYQSNIYFLRTVQRQPVGLIGDSKLDVGVKMSAGDLSTVYTGSWLG